MQTLVGRFNDIISRLHGNKARPPAPTIAPEISHTIILENDRPEYHHLANSRLFSYGDQAGVPVNTGGVIIANPAGSGVLVVLEQYDVVDATSPLNSIIIAIGGKGALAASGISLNITGRYRDLRYGTATRTAVGFAQVDLAAPLFTDTNRLIALQTLRQPRVKEWVLPPDSLMHFRCALPAHAIAYSFYGRERAIEPSEQLQQ